MIKMLANLAFSLPIASIVGSEFFLWYGVGYFCTFILGVMFLVIALLGLGEHEAAVDHDIDHDFDIDHDIDHDFEHDHDVGHEMEHEHHFFQSILSLLGIGRCPMSIVIMTFLFTFSVIGVIALIITKPILGVAAIYGLVSYGLAFFGAFFMTGSFARLIGRLLPSYESSIKSKRELAGKIGTVLYDFDTAKQTGFIQVYDGNGSLIEQRAHNTDTSQPLKKHDKVLIHGWRKEEQKLQVRKAPAELLLDL